jgi:hypothetical protein
MDPAAWTPQHGSFRTITSQPGPETSLGGLAPGLPVAWTDSRADVSKTSTSPVGKRAANRVGRLKTG